MTPFTSAIPGTHLADSEWPAKVAQGVEDVVASVHDRLVRPVLIAARAVVYGVLIAAMAFVLIVLFTIALIRVLDVYAFGHRVWPAYALVGALLVLGGAFAWAKRRPAGGNDG